MKRPLLYFILAFILGIWLNDNIIGIAFIAILFILCETSCYLSKKRNRYRKKLLIEIKDKLLLIFCMLFGIVFCYSFNFFRFNEVSVFDNKTKEIIGVVSNEGVNKEKYWEYILKNNSVCGKQIKSRILLKTKEKLEYGDKLKVNATLKLPDSVRNKNTFNYAEYLRTQNVYITADAEEIKVISNSNLFIVEKISFLIRNKVREFTNETLNETNASILNALIIGDDSRINYSLTEDYKKAGMLHLLVVSGGHTVFLIALLKFIFSFIKISNNMSKYLYIFVIFIYIFITGGSSSILRAGIGIIIVIIGGLIGRQNDGFTTLGLVAFILLINNPNVLFSLSFLLSFGGVIGIMLCYEKIREKLEFIPKIIAEPLALTIAAQLFVTPIIIYSFNVIYLGGIISNILTLTLSGVIMMGGIIFFILYLIVPPIVLFPMKCLSFLIFLMNKVAEFFGSISCMEIYVITPNMFSIILYYVTLLYVFIKRASQREKGIIIIKYPQIPIIIRKNFKLIITGLCIAIIIISNFNIIDVDKALKISMIDVGHGDSILITTPNNKYILIDTGDKYYKGEKTYDVGVQTIIPYLLKQGIKKIDLLILTHMDSDHIGGYESVTNAIDIKELGISVNSGKKEEYKKIKDIAQKQLININAFKRGDKFTIDGVKFAVLMPQKKREILEENNDSIVLLMEYQKKKVLFMGDLEETGEKELLNLEKDINIDVLKVGHHGSITSSTDEFISETTPEISLISVGNRFKSIPSKEVIKRLSSVHSKVYRTDEVGEINLIIDNGEIVVETTY